MKKYTLIAAMLPLVFVTNVVAQQFQFAGFQDVESAFANHEAELERLSARLAAFEQDVADPAQAVVVADAGCPDCCCSPSGMFAQVELLLLALRSHEPGEATANSLHAGSRWTLGYRMCNGNALRVRVFDFQVTDDNDNEYEVNNIDIEYALNFGFDCGWCGELSVGARRGEFFEEATGGNVNNSWGPLVGLELRAPLTCCLDLYAGVRQSYQFGHDENADDPMYYAISEVRFGAEYRQCTGYGEMFLRTGVEAQNYQHYTDGTEDTALLGLTLSAGLQR